MRIAVLCADLGIRVGGSKGASVHLGAITKAFAELGHRVLLIGVGSSSPQGCDAGLGAPLDLPAPPRAGGVRTVLLAHPGRAEGLERARRKIAFQRTVLERAQPELRCFRPELIYERLSLYSTAGLHLAGTVGATHVVEVNALLTGEEAAWRGLHLADRARAAEAATLRRADLRVAVSDEVAAQVAQLAPGRPTVVVPNGVNTAGFRHLPPAAAARAQLGLPQDRALAAFVGALRPWHGVDVALAAMARSPQPWDLVVAGDGPVRAELAALATALGVGDRVHWLGPVAHHRVPLVLAAAKVALAPYPPLEGFAFSPLKVFEYLAAGVPVVASDVGQLRGLLDHGRLGTLVTPGDADELAGAVHDILFGPGSSAAAQRARVARARTLASDGWTQRAARIVTAAAGLGPRMTARAPHDEAP